MAHFHEHTRALLPFEMSFMEVLQFQFSSVAYTRISKDELETSRWTYLRYFCKFIWPKLILSDHLSVIPKQYPDNSNTRGLPILLAQSK